MMMTLAMAILLTGQVPSPPRPAPPAEVKAKVDAEKKATAEAERARLIARRHAKRAYSPWGHSAWLEKEARLHPDLKWREFRTEAEARAVLDRFHRIWPHDGDGVTRGVK